MVTIGNYEYNPDEPISPQVFSYDCSADSTSWFGRSIGWDWTELNVWGEFVKVGIANARYGLLDGTGAGIVSWLAMQPIPADNGLLSWGACLGLAGTRPLLIGGQAWDHWSGVRSVNGSWQLELANPAPGWDGIFQTMNEEQYEQLGPMYGVWLNPE